jgi:tetratricopeptide (TPR) repeat protein
MDRQFLTTEEIAGLFQKAFAVLQKYDYKKAKSYFDLAFEHDPYPVEIHYRLALYFAQHANEALFLYHLGICYDIDSSYLDKALRESLIAKSFDRKTIRLIKEQELSRTWQVMRFEQIEPRDDDYEVVLRLKKDVKKNVEEWYYSLPHEVTRYFQIFDEKGTDKYMVRDKITISSDSDRRYCGYEKVYLAIKKLSPWVKDVRFFMSSESMAWTDEIRIKKGKFYAYRYILPSDYSYDRLKLWEKLVKSNPRDASLKLFIAQRYLREAFSEVEHGDNDKKVVQVYIRKARHYSARIRADYIWALYFWKNSEFDRAKNYLLRAAQNTKDWEIFSKLGELALKDADYSAAATYFSKAIKLNPIILNTYFYRGVALEYLGKAQKALEDHTLFIARTQNYNANDLIYRADQLVHRNFTGNAYFFYGSAIQKARLYKKELAQKLLNDPEADSTGFYSKLRKKMDSVITNGYIGTSVVLEMPLDKLRFCDKALEVDPLSVPAWYNKGVVLQEMGKLDEAEECYTKALTLDDTYIEALNNKFILLYNKKQYDEALALAVKMTVINPTYANGWLDLGNVEIALKNYKGAAAAYSKLIKLLPDYEKGYHGLSTAYVLLGKYAECITMGKKALRINPKIAEVISNIACSYDNLGKHKQALMYANRSIKINPRYYHPYYVKACIYAKMGKVAESLELVKKTLELDPSQAESLKHDPDMESLRENGEFKKLVRL